MSQPFPPPQNSNEPSASGRVGNNQDVPYGIPPSASRSSYSPYAAYAHDSAPQASPPQASAPAHHPYLHSEQSAVPTQPVAQQLSSVGQPANRLVSGSRAVSPYLISPAGVTSQPVPATAPPHPRQTPIGSRPIAAQQAGQFKTEPWTGNRLTALMLTLLACGVQLIWTFNDANAQPSFHTGTGFRLFALIFYMTYTLGAWWCILFFTPIAAIIRNRPSTVMAAAAIELFLIDVLIFNNGFTSAPFPILSLLATASAAIATTYMNQRTSPSRPWSATLMLAINLFLLISMVHRLIRLFLSVYGVRTSDYTMGFWLTTSNSQPPGIPLVPGTALIIIIALFAAISIYLGDNPANRSAFTRLCGIAPAIATLQNIYILSVFGISSGSTGSAFNITSIKGDYTYVAFRAWVASIILGVIAGVGVLLLRRHSSADGHNRMNQGISPTAAALTPRYQNYRPYTR